MPAFQVQYASTKDQWDCCTYLIDEMLSAMLNPQFSRSGDAPNGGFTEIFSESIFNRIARVHVP
jgi:hypothetical protein